MFRSINILGFSLLLLACSQPVASNMAAPEPGKPAKLNTVATSAAVPAKTAVPKITAAPTTVPAKTAAGFALYTQGLKAEAIQRGYPTQLIQQVFASLEFHPRVVVSDNTQPETIETLDTYLPKRVSAVRIKMAREAMVKYRAELNQVSKKYGVPPRFIVALWGLESSFGRITGNYSVPSALATLAYDGRREDFFKKEFFLALDILAQGHVELSAMKGSWAGAMGHTQFMPSAFNNYAQDGDGDGHKDIWTNRQDAFASIANYLKVEGWQSGQTWGRQVKLPAKFDLTQVIPIGSKDRAQWLNWWQQSAKTVQQWQQLGVRNPDGSALPNSQIMAAMVMPDAPGGRAYLAYANYQTLMHWNRSYYFVSSVGYLADLLSDL